MARLLRIEHPGAVWQVESWGSHLHSAARSRCISAIANLHRVDDPARRFPFRGGLGPVSLPQTPYGISLPRVPQGQISTGYTFIAWQRDGDVTLTPSSLSLPEDLHQDLCGDPSRHPSPRPLAQDDRVGYIFSGVIFPLSCSTSRVKRRPLFTDRLEM